MEFSAGRIALLLASQRPPVTIYKFLRYQLYLVIILLPKSSCRLLEMVLV